MALAAAFQGIRRLDSPRTRTDLELNLPIADETRYVDAAVFLVVANAQPYSATNRHWRAAGFPPLRPRGRRCRRCTWRSGCSTTPASAASSPWREVREGRARRIAVGSSAVAARRAARDQRAVASSAARSAGPSRGSASAARRHPDRPRAPARGPPSRRASRRRARAGAARERGDPRRRVVGQVRDDRLRAAVGNESLADRVAGGAEVRRKPRPEQQVVGEDLHAGHRPQTIRGRAAAASRRGPRRGGAPAPRHQGRPRR